MWYIEILFYLFIFVAFISFFSLAPWVPTRKDDLDRIYDIVELSPGESFLEMWCGTAKVSIFMAKNNPDSFITWVELSPFFYFISKIRVYFSWLDNIKIIYGNALKLDLSRFDAIYVFWLPETVSLKVFPQIKDIKNKNFRLVSYCFKMTNNHFKEKKYKTEGKYAIYKYNL